MTGGAMTVRTVAALVLLVTPAGCGDREAESPVAPGCTYAVSVGTSAFGGGGGPGTASVTTRTGCAWTAASQAEWIAIAAGASGTGNGTVSFTVGPHEGTETRTGALLIANERFSVTQNACGVRLQPAQVTVGSNSTQAEVVIEIEEQCRWTVESGSPWISIEPASGTGPARVTVRVEENDAGDREAVVRVNSHPVTVRQGGEPCRFDAAIVPASFPVTGGTGMLRVHTRHGCAWRAETLGGSWLTFSGPAEGNGPAELLVAVAPSVEAGERRLTVRVGTETVDVLQGGNPRRCEYRVEPVEAFVHSRGGSGTVAVSTAPGCRWTATSRHGFVRIRGAADYSGSATLVYDVEANPEWYVADFRKGAIELRWMTPTEGQNVWFWQFGNCRTLLAASEISFDAAGGQRSITILTDSPFTCPWRVEPTPDWVRVGAGGHGGPRAGDPPFVHRGDGQIVVSVSPNASSQPRSTEVVVGERTLRVTQAGR